jgi:hypothetical protein
LRKHRGEEAEKEEALNAETRGALRKARVEKAELV